MLQTPWVQFGDCDLGSPEHRGELQSGSAGSVSLTDHASGSLQNPFNDCNIAGPGADLNNGHRDGSMSNSPLANCALHRALPSSGSDSRGSPTSSMRVNDESSIRSSCSMALQHHSQNMDFGRGIEDQITKARLQVARGTSSNPRSLQGMQPETPPRYTGPAETSGRRLSSRNVRRDTSGTSTDSQGSRRGSEPRLLRLVLPWAFGQRLLAIAASLTPSSQDAALYVEDGDQEMEPPPPYDHLSRRGTPE